MKAVFYERKGPAREVLQLGEQPLPQPAAGEVRVRVHVSAVNPSDTKQRGGHRGNVTMPFPVVIPHQDGAGVIDAVGAGVDPARVGQRVWIYEATLGRAFGTCAEYTMVHGGAGAVGYYAVQIAKIAGARVIATVSRPEQAERAREAGADHVLNYREDDLVRRVREITGADWGVDRAVDVAFGANLAVNMELLRPGAVIATYASDAVPDPQIPFWPMLARDLTVRFVLVYAMSRAAHDEAAAFISEALEAGRFVHQVFQRYPLERCAEAHEATESMRNVGKVLLDLA